MVCTGHHGSKHRPNFPGADEFQVGAQFKSLVDALKALQCSAKKQPIKPHSLNTISCLETRQSRSPHFYCPVITRKLCLCLALILLIRENKFTLTTTRISPDTRNKRVVIIGIGNSGGDIAVELGRCAKQVGHSGY